ncbi:MAG: DUF1579 domain-containing protein [Thermoanaerobaculia bacterium]
MRHTFRTTALTLLLACATGLAAQEAKQKAGPPDEKAMMEAMQKAATPGDAHKKLDPIVGTFDTRVRMWMDPSKPPEDSAGTTVNSWVLGNRYVEQKYDGTFMGEPFNGVGYTGYDNVQKKYVGVWMDSAGTGTMLSTGTADAAGKTFKLKATLWDPTTGKPTSVDEKMTIVDNDHHNFEMWGKGPNGKTFKMMEIQYTRKK